MNTHVAAAVWIGGAIAGFMLWWPIGAAILGAVLITAMSQQVNGYIDNAKLRMPRFITGSSGNTAFDEYREATLRQLEDDQAAFGGFVDKLRRAKDRKEFDQFMDERTVLRHRKSQ